MNENSTNGHGACCAICKRNDVRLYRPYGDFFRYESLRCNAHLPERDWWVPTVMRGKAIAAGYGAMSADEIAKWRALPEADPNGWTRETGEWKPIQPAA